MDVLQLEIEWAVVIRVGGELWGFSVHLHTW